jgi:hypothetical protein
MVVPANERGWGWPGKPGSAADTKYRRDHLTRVVAGGIMLLVRKEAAPLFESFVDELVYVYGYPLNGVADDWGYANRDVRGAPGVKSNHAWGLAIDLNATANPMTNDGGTHTDLPPGVSKLAARYGLRWGGDYSGRKDPMHFEFTGSVRDCQEYVRQLHARRALASNTQKETHTVAALITEDDKAIWGFDGVRAWYVPNTDILASVKATGVYGDNKVTKVPAGTIGTLLAAETLTKAQAEALGILNANP